MAQAWRTYLARIAEPVVYVLYPPRCGGCDRRGTYFCEHCRQGVRPPSRHVHGVRGAAGLVCAGEFSGPLRAAIHRFKYEGDCPLAQPLAALLVDGLKAHALWAELQAKPPVIVPVPLHLHREKERGFNQCKLLAQEVSAATGWMILPHLQRSRETRSQVGLDADARRENVREAFAWLSDAGDAPDRVLLIDDVCTTGATLSECVAALKQMGSVEVHVAAVARAAGPEADAAI